VQSSKKSSFNFFFRGHVKADADHHLAEKTQSLAEPLEPDARDLFGAVSRPMSPAPADAAGDSRRVVSAAGEERRPDEGGARLHKHRRTHSLNAIGLWIFGVKV
jgi:hypothetical protein